MDANTEVQRSPDTADRIRDWPHIDRIVVGLLLTAAGLGWLLDQAGVSVPWRMFPAAALVLIALALLATLAGGRGPGALIGLGAVALVAAVAVGVGAGRYAGPIGDRVVAPATDEWPVETRLSAGNVTVDLTQHALPPSGRLQVDVGAGQVVVLLPRGAQPEIDARTTAGTVQVDGVRVGDGVDVHWSQPATGTAKVSVNVQVGLGDIEVNHE